MYNLTPYQIRKQVRSAVYRNRELCKFLKENRIFTIYIENCVNYVISDRIFHSPYLAWFVESIEIDKYNVINISFQWDKTKQGIDYWNNIQRRYRDLFWHNK